MGCCNACSYTEHGRYGMSWLYAETVECMSNAGSVCMVCWSFKLCCEILLLLNMAGMGRLYVLLRLWGAIGACERIESSTINIWHGSVWYIRYVKTDDYQTRAESCNAFDKCHLRGIEEEAVSRKITSCETSCKNILLVVKIIRCKTYWSSWFTQITKIFLHAQQNFPDLRFPYTRAKSTNCWISESR